MNVSLATIVPLVQSTLMKIFVIPDFIVLLELLVLTNFHVLMERTTNMKDSLVPKLVFHVKADITVRTMACPTTLNSVANLGTTVRRVLWTIVLTHVQMDHSVKLDQFNPNLVPMVITPMAPNQTALLVRLVKSASKLLALAPLVAKNVLLDSTVQAVT